MCPTLVPYYITLQHFTFFFTASLETSYLCLFEAQRVFYANLMHPLVKQNMFGLFYVRLDKCFIGFESNYSLDKLWSMVSQMVWTNNL